MFVKLTQKLLWKKIIYDKIYMDYYLKIKNNGKVCIICQEMRFQMDNKELKKDV